MARQRKTQERLSNTQKTRCLAIKETKKIGIKKGITSYKEEPDEINLFTRSKHEVLTVSIQRMVPRNNGNTGSPLSEAADLIILDATVDSRYSQTTSWVENSWFLKRKESKKQKNKKH